MTAEPDSPSEDRNSGDKTAADLLREQAAECDGKADQLTREASMMRSAAFDYRRRADAAEREQYGREWADLQAGDTITLRVHDRQEGWIREQRYVVAVNWPVLTLRDGDREYDLDVSSDTDRDVRIVP